MREGRLAHLHEKMQTIRHETIGVEPHAVPAPVPAEAVEVGVVVGGAAEGPLPGRKTSTRDKKDSRDIKV